VFFLACWSIASLVLSQPTFLKPFPTEKKCSFSASVNNLQTRVSKMDDIRFEDFPVELLFNITEHLLGARAFGSVVSFALCNSRLRGVLPLLYRNVGRVNLDAGEDALIWVTENDELEILKLLLESGVDPNARFWSCLPDFARQDVFAAQRVRPRRAPRLDGHFIAKLLQEDIVHFENKFTVNPWKSSEEALVFRECTWQSRLTIPVFASDSVCRVSRNRERRHTRRS
jgi:hypothetical protein